MDVCGKGRLSSEVSKLDEALKTIREVRESVAMADMLASLPSPEERMGQEAGDDV